MSRRESKVEYIDTMSSGDSNQKSKQRPRKEVNNNEVDELSKELSEMGCIVDAMKRPPNICVETCVYESDSEKSPGNGEDRHEEDAYSDEFEEDKSDEESDTDEKSKKMHCRESHPTPSSIKISNSQSTISSNKPPVSVSGRSGRSTNYGSVSVPSSRRTNMSFTNDRLREIERHNHILLTKILSARNSKKSSIPSRDQPLRKPLTSAAVTRKNQQRQIDHDNMILLKKIQRAKSSAYTIRR